jgi:hypothetical protein
MAISFTLTDEDGEVVERVEGPLEELTRLIASIHGDPDASSFPMLRYVDPYGDTVFNRLQIKPFLEEWRRLYQKAESDELRAAIREVERLAQKVEESTHIYLKFWGD